MRKYLLLSSAIALSLAAVMLMAYRGKRRSEVNEPHEHVYSDPHYNDGRHYHRGPVRATLDGATDVVRGTGHAIGHGLKNIFGGVKHRDYRDSKENYRS